MLQTVKVVPVPALGAVTTLTVTVAEAFTQGGAPRTVYVYTPGVEVPGMNVDDTGAPPGPIHAPPGCGEPPRTANRLKAASLLHTVVLALVPAEGGWFTVTVTVAVGSTQGCGSHGTV